MKKNLLLVLMLVTLIIVPVVTNVNTASAAEAVYIHVGKSETWSYSVTLPQSYYTPYQCYATVEDPSIADASVYINSIQVGWQTTLGFTVTYTGISEGETEVDVALTNAIHVGPFQVIVEGHKWKKSGVAEEPGCLSEGKMLYKCTVCGETKTEPIPAHGHDDGKWHVAKPATYTKTGLKELRCTRCDAVLDTEMIPKVDYNGTPTPIKNMTLAYTQKQYTGKALKPAVTVTAVLDGNTIKLTKGKDYSVTYSNNVNVGKATVEITGIGYFTGTLSKTFKITNKISNAELTFTKAFYTGKAIKPAVTVTAKQGTETVTLVKGKDYSVKYENNRKLGTASVIIAGKGFYTGSIKKSFKITAIPLEELALKYTSRTYTGKEIKLTPTVKATLNNKKITLKKGTDYTVTYKNNVNAGTATVTVKGKGNYTGTLSKTFDIKKVKLSDAELEFKTTLYTGKAIKPIAKVTAKVGGKTVSLTAGIDFSVKYDNNKKVGTATVTITGKGNFTGVITRTFNITK